MIREKYMALSHQSFPRITARFLQTVGEREDFQGIKDQYSEKGKKSIAGLCQNYYLFFWSFFFFFLICLGVGGFWQINFICVIVIAVIINIIIIIIIITIVIIILLLLLLLLMLLQVLLLLNMQILIFTAFYF